MTKAVEEGQDRGTADRGSTGGSGASPAPGADPRVGARPLGEAILESSDDAIFAKSLDGIILSWNPAAERLYGYTPDEVIGNPAAMLAPPDRADEITRILGRIVAGERVDHFETERVRKDGTPVSVSLTVSPLYDEAGKIVAAATIARDVTLRVSLEQQLRHAVKMEAVGRVAGGIAHDFNNLLSAIMGFGTLWLSRHADDDDTDPITEIVRAAERAGELTAQLLAFSRNDPRAPRAVDVTEVVRGIETMLRHMMGTEAKLELDLATEPLPVWCDASQLEQILVNLAVNARDAMPDGGKFTLQTSGVTLDDDYMSTHIGVSPGPHVLITASDTGTGMSEDIREHAFEPFFTTKEVSRGTGLGLATVYGIVEQAGGRIWLYSEEGIGSTFRIYLPLAPGEALLVADPPRRLESPSIRAVVLLAEDDETVGRLAAAILAAAGHEVVPAASGDEAAEILLDTERSIDLLLTDLVMPGLSGIELVELAQRARPGLPSVVMSGYAGSQIATPSLGISAFVAKPFTAAALTAAIAAALDEPR